jgi:hypothetical protein
MQMSALWLCLRLCQFKISWDTLAFRLPLTYKRLIVWDIYRPSYVIGKRKQQGSSNFAPRQTSPRGIFCDDQSAFSIPLGINEKKGSEEHIKSRQAWLQWQSDIIYCFFLSSKRVILLQNMVHFTDWPVWPELLFLLEKFLLFDIY